MSGKKKTNGHDPATARMVELLEEIRDGIKTSNARLEALSGEVEGLRGEIREVRDDVRAFKVDTVHAFLALNHDIIGEEIRGGPRGTLKARVERLEEAVFKKMGT
jgi:hypothetical protein